MLKLLWPALFVGVFHSVFQVDAGYVNNYDNPVHFECGKNEYLYSVVSQHSNHYEDRQWMYSCRGVPRGSSLVQCQWHYNLNEWDQPLAFRCPGNRAITGVVSRHNNHHEDRIFGFRCCYLRGRTQADCRVTGYLNNWDARMTYSTPSGYAIVGFVSHHSNHHEDRRWKAEICRV